MCWHTHVIPAFKRLREEDCKFVASLSYIVSESVSKKKKKKSWVLGMVAHIVIPSTQEDGGLRPSWAKS
jgi:hypothetical protein